MRRISTATRVVNKFGAGKDGFTNGDAVGGIPATDLEDVFFDHVQEELAGVVEAAGLTLDPNDRGQVLAAMQMLSAPIVGLTRNVKMSVASASASATLTADQIVVASALGDRHYRLGNFNKTVNLGTTGPGGLDTGASPVSGFVALYAIYNPATGASALLARNATSAAQPEVYGGANMPAGYTASALLSVWPTNASGQFVIGGQRGRKISITGTTAFATNTLSASPVMATISVIPLNAVGISGRAQVGSTLSAGAQGVSLQANNAVNGIGFQEVSMNVNASGAVGVVTGGFSIEFVTPRTLYYTFSGGTGSGLAVVVSSYWI